MKILYTDLTIRPDQLFWHRDLGLLTKAFRDLGHDAYLVVHLGTEASAPPGAPNKLNHPREQPCVVPQVRDVAGPILPHMRDLANTGQKTPAAGDLPTFAPSHVPTSAASNIKQPKSNIEK